jgi:hypothetical protein
LTEIHISINCEVDEAGICELSSSTKSRGAVENLLIIKAFDNKKITNLNRFPFGHRAAKLFKKLTEIIIVEPLKTVVKPELENLRIINAYSNQKIDRN